LKMKEIERRILRALLKDSKRSDRELAKVLGRSQATITRIRNKLERNGTIQDYTIIPDFRKMGFELLAINLAKIRPELLSPEIKEKAKRFIAQFPNTIYASSGQGMSMNAVDIAFYKNFTEYQQRIHLMRTEWKDFVEDIQSFIVSIGTGEFKRFSLTHLKDVPL